MTEPGLHFIWHSRVIHTTQDIFLRSSSFDLEKIH